MINDFFGRYLEFSSHRVQLVVFRVLEREGKFSINISNYR